ncbi:hypothetical protein AS189_06090 [Arthrobacter alpinus]|uniref:Uncharacterized protein n=1 Tax=Arthrobacter alpinus TaxID=656366 RepID=A0A0S2LXJ2_9MICC|nr:hypothetical protein AS189_06090 [Arthrobacter alpinus]
MLPTTITDQPLQAVPRRYPKILHILRRMDQLELPQGCSLHGPVDTLDVLLMPDALGVFTPERSDHILSI